MLGTCLPNLSPTSAADVRQYDEGHPMVTIQTSMGYRVCPSALPSLSGMRSFRNILVDDLVAGMFCYCSVANTEVIGFSTKKTSCHERARLKKYYSHD